MDEIWSRHRALIQRLYQKERKSLQEVKEILERDHQFPDTPLWVYETKLRDVLCIRKKLKKEYWPIISQHHKRRNGRETSLYVDGIEIPWKKAWKEIRRSGAREATVGNYVALPRGIEMRTPSPTLPHRPHTMKTTDNFVPTTSSLHPRQLYPTPRSFEQPQSSRNLQEVDKDLCEVTAEYVKQDKLPLLGNSENGDITTMDKMKFSSSVTTRPLQKYARHRYSGTGRFRDAASNNTLQHALATVDFHPAIELMLETLPWQDCRLFLFSMISGGITIERQTEIVDGITFSLMPADVFALSQSSMNSTRAHETIFPGIWSMEQTMSSIISFPSNTELYRFVGQAFYLLSNSSLLVFITRPEFIHTLLYKMPRKILLAIFKTRISSFHSAWESLLEISSVEEQNRKELSSLVIEIGLQHKTWFIRRKDELVLSAIIASRLDVLLYLLKKGACPRNTVRRIDAVVQAALVESLPFISLLLQDCLMNEPITDAIETEKPPFFTGILSKFTEAKPPVLRLENDCHRQVLDTAFGLGAKADLKCLGNFKNTYHKFLRRAKIPRKWDPTYLDWSFHWDKRLFDLLIQHHSQNEEVVTRYGVYSAATQGKTAVLEYLYSRRPEKNEVKGFLKLILTEQLMKPPHRFSATIVRGFMELGIKLDSQNNNLCHRRLVESLHGHGLNDDSYWVLEHLLQGGDTIDARTFCKGVSKDGTHILEDLSELGANVSEVGGPALSWAICLENFEAVNWLLDSGVDINGTFHIQQKGLGLTGNFTIIGCSMLWSRPGLPLPSLAMLQHLVDHGAELELSKGDASPVRLIEAMFQGQYPESILSRKILISWLVRWVKVVAERDVQSLFETVLHRLNSSVGDMSKSRELVDDLFRYFRPPNPGRILSGIIKLGVRNELIEELIQVTHFLEYWDCEIHSSNLTPLQTASSVGNVRIAAKLLEHGADVNTPAQGHRGQTALQAACGWNPINAEERARHLTLLKLLLDKCADVNADPAPEGQTAITQAVWHGDVGVASLLLANGADPNILSSGLFTIMLKGTALDFAARSGKLDMAKLLLNSGGMSAMYGSTGYQGSIEVAKKWNHFAVVDLIHDHAANEREVILKFPELQLERKEPIERYDQRADRYTSDTGYSSASDSETSSSSDIYLYISDDDLYF